MRHLQLITCIVCVVFSLISSIQGNPRLLRKMQNTIDHIFMEMGKFRRDLSYVEVRIDELQESIGNITDEFQNGPSSTDTGSSDQPVNVVIDGQGHEDQDGANLKLLMDNAIKSLSKEKFTVRKMLSDFKLMIRDGVIGNDVDERLRAIEDKLKEDRVPVFNPGQKVEVVEVNKGDVRYSFSARLGKSRDILPDPRAKRLGHKMHRKLIQFGDVIHNDGHVYDSRSGKFTCKKDGVYLFVFFVEGIFRKNPGVSDQTSMLAISVDGKFQTLAASKVFSKDGRNTGGNSVILNLIRGQQVWMEAVAPISEMITLREWVSTFSGTLLY